MFPPNGECPPDYSLTLCLSDTLEFQRFVNESSVLDAQVGCPTSIAPLEFMDPLLCPVESNVTTCDVDGAQFSPLPCSLDSSNSLRYIPIRMCPQECLNEETSQGADSLVYAADSSIVLEGFLFFPLEIQVSNFPKSQIVSNFQIQKQT